MIILFYYLPPELTGKRKRGTPKKYGDRVKKPTIDELQNEVTLHLYSQDMTIRYSALIVKAIKTKKLS
ncbi:MAG: hypothetical protein U9N52_06895 [Campylobacterota bacterium]|nr:hypothetical protein [Campylobacterota bacterium]